MQQQPDGKCFTLNFTNSIKIFFNRFMIALNIAPIRRPQ